MTVPKPFVFTLNDREAAELHAPPEDSHGGRQELERALLAQLAQTPNTITLDDAGVGKLLRYMAQYDGTGPAGTGGGLQGRLHRAFSRSLRERFHL